ncbi:MULTISPECIES: hypothetical protein [Adhaeribacter]|jgi:hypothetical protein|uniref:Uncharacterized protein n=2 Tax=Adhaeribacter TaxID=299566 RepID=A0ABS1BXQ9_9BACT|nr:hypothetical protein [Adhaeribacter terrigena]MBK0401929.1 hypothetical protein [Adhaeribacter terrigena]
MKNSAKVNPVSCRCKLSKLVLHLKQMNGLISVPAPKGNGRINLRAAEAVFVQYI